MSNKFVVTIKTELPPGEAHWMVDLGDEQDGEQLSAKMSSVMDAMKAGTVAS